MKHVPYVWIFGEKNATFLLGAKASQIFTSVPETGTSGIGMRTAF
jgi:hypothetical protein